jgi:hypothetical protein
MNDLASQYTVIQIVPRRTNQPDGIGDYATHLAEGMLQRAGANSIFVSGTPARVEPPRADRWRTDPVQGRTAHGLAKQLSELCRGRAATAVVVHVSGYGYEKRGVPYWLLQGLRIWRRTHPNCRLFGIFHELFATGRIWNSSFWLSRAQKNITRGIWEICDGGVATTNSYFDQLAAWRPHMRNCLKTMPVFSNVGEPSVVVPTDERALNLAVFGQSGVESDLYSGQQYEISASVAKSFCIQKIIDIGARTGAGPRQLGSVPIMALGQLQASGVGQHLMSCRFGLLNYDVARLEKSGVFAAYAAHGVIPVCIGSQANPPPGLKEGRHFIRWPLKTLPDSSAMQKDLFEWYNGHSIAKHADLLASWSHTCQKVQ